MDPDGPGDRNRCRQLLTHGRGGWDDDGHAYSQACQRRGAAPFVGLPVSVITTVGRVSSTTADPDTCTTTVIAADAAVDGGSSAICSFASRADIGDEPGVTLTFQGTGAPAVGEVIVSSPGLDTVIIPFMLTGPAASVTASADRELISSPAAMAAANITVTVQDSNGNGVQGARAVMATSSPTVKPLVLKAGEANARGLLPAPRARTPVASATFRLWLHRHRSVRTKSRSSSVRSRRL